MRLERVEGATREGTIRSTATIVLLVCASALLVRAQESQAPNAAPAESVQGPVAESNPAAVARRLLTVKRIYVDSFGDDPISKQVQAMVVTALTESKRFIITENKERADAILKGTAVEKSSQELHAYGESTGVAAAAGGGSSSGGTGSGGFAGRATSIKDSAAHTETIDNARLAVRLVGADGDVIWATTQESRGAKYKGASADMADKVVKQLLRDLEKLAPTPPVNSKSQISKPQ